MKKVLDILMLSCLKATQLVEKKLHFNLSWTEKIRLKWHLRICDACKHYEKHSMLIENSVKNIEEEVVTRMEVDKLIDLINSKITNN